MEEDRSWCVYMHVNKTNNKRYIGQTSRIKARFGTNGSGYLRKKKDGTYVHPAFANAIIKYGWDNFEHIIVKNNLTKDEADILEIELIEKYDTQNPKNGYNIRNGGSHGKLSEESKEKLKETMKGRYDGEKNPFYGKTHSKEVRKILSKTAKRTANNKNKEELHNHMVEMAQIAKRKRDNGEIVFEKTGPKSKEVKEKLSKALKEYYKTHEHPTKGTHKTEAQKEHMRQKMTGRIMTEEHKKNIGKAHAPYDYICVETEKTYYSAGEAERQTGIAKASIQRAANGQQNTAGGYHWKKVLKS